jgi:translocating chain-associated membrane protein 1
VFTIMSFVWGMNVIVKEQYYGHMSKLWEDFPNHPMSSVHKFYFLIQLAYYLHMLPELYFQKVKKDEQSPKIVYSITAFSVIAVAYMLW